jgi:hypothetical protein
MPPRRNRLACLISSFLDGGALMALPPACRRSRVSPSPGMHPGTHPRLPGLTFHQPSAASVSSIDGPCDPGNLCAGAAATGPDSHGRMDHPKKALMVRNQAWLSSSAPGHRCQTQERWCAAARHVAPPDSRGHAREIRSPRRSRWPEVKLWSAPRLRITVTTLHESSCGSARPVAQLDSRGTRG